MGDRLNPQHFTGDANPFRLDDDLSYQRWRNWKLAHGPAHADDVCVDINDPRCLDDRERAALLSCIARHSVAVYRSAVTEEDKSIPRRLGAQLGLQRLDANWLADEDGISSIAVSDRSDGRGGFIPYTNRAIGWHTDGYYHPEGRQIHGMILHAVRPARNGGDNLLLDHERVYIGLRDQAPELIQALMQHDVMTIPARADEDGVARSAQSGPVFSVDAQDGSLHMRYTARSRSIEWKADAATRTAVQALETILREGRSGVWRVRLASGMGVVGHNVLHTRFAFEDDPAYPRLLYRARFLDRVAAAVPAPWL